MEHTLGERNYKLSCEFGRAVLILVLVEHTLGGFCVGAINSFVLVLILVLVEHTLGAMRKVLAAFQQARLNPCFSGTYSRSYYFPVIYSRRDRLNPCFSGTYSRRFSPLVRSSPKQNVLILVLVEHTLGDGDVLEMPADLAVLILVLVEHTLGAYTVQPMGLETLS